MSPSLSTRPIFPMTWRGRTPGFAEFNLLLNLFNEPTLLIDYHRGAVLGANSALIELTAFTYSEITSISLNDLLPGFSNQILALGEEKEALLSHHSRDPIPVIVRVVSLDRSYQWFLLILTPIAVYQQLQAEERRRELLLGALYDLARLTTQSDLKSSFMLGLKIGSTILGASILLIYQADAGFPQLNRVAYLCDNPDIFPETLPSTNLAKLQTPTLWLSGKRVSTDLHRAARIANLSYLATVPLGQPGAWNGLLVAGDPSASPSEDILSLLEILGLNISAAMQHFILQSNLASSLSESRRQLAILENALENSREGVVLLKPDLTILELNPAAELMLGYASKEVFGRPVADVLIGSESLGAALRSALQGIATHDLGNITLHRRNGQSFPGRVETVPVMDGDTLTSITVLISDVSENEQIRVRTMQLEQRAVLGELTAIFAHEVRNPINNISTGLQLMAARLPPDDPNQEVIDRLEGDCSRLIHLMDTVLAFSRPQKYDLKPTDLPLLLERIIERWQPRFVRANIKSYLQAPDNLPKILGDPRALEQVFTNLISNAVQAMSNNDGGTLAIKFDMGNLPEHGPAVLVTVSDSGPGIPEDILKHIWEPFVTTNPKGTGLGLAITRRIVFGHNGRIEVNSFPGGTVFSVLLPAVVGEAS
jgi:two-component system sensor histidine kinase AtoS